LVSWDRAQQVAKAIRSSFGFSSYSALRHMHQRWWQYFQLTVYNQEE
jgi:hypothetical protein